MLFQADIACRTSSGSEAEPADNATHASLGGAMDAHCLLMFVADGEGVGPRGRHAAPITVELLRGFLAERLGRIRDADPRLLRQRVADALREGLRRANREVWRQCKGASAARLAGFIVLPRNVLAFSVGDAHAYFIDPEGQIERLTRDLAHAGEAAWLLGRGRRLPDAAVFLDAYHTADEGFYAVCSEGLDQAGASPGPARIAEVLTHTPSVEAALDFLLAERAGAAAALAEIGVVPRRGEVPPPLLERQSERVSGGVARRARNVPLPPPPRPRMLALLGEFIADADPLLRVGAVFAVGVSLTVLASQTGGSWLQRVLTLRGASGPPTAPALQLASGEASAPGPAPGAQASASAAARDPGGAAAGMDGSGGNGAAGAPSGPSDGAGSGADPPSDSTQAAARPSDSLPPASTAEEANSPAGSDMDPKDPEGAADDQAADAASNASATPPLAQPPDARAKASGSSRGDSSPDRPQATEAPEESDLPPTEEEAAAIPPTPESADELAEASVPDSPVLEGRTESEAITPDDPMDSTVFRGATTLAGTSRSAPLEGAAAHTLDRPAVAEAASVVDMPPADAGPPRRPLELLLIDPALWEDGRARALVHRGRVRRGQHGRSPGFFAGETLLHLTIFDAEEYAEMNPTALILIEAAVVVPAGATPRPSPLHRRVRWPMEPQTRADDRWIYSFPIAELQSALDIRPGEAWRLTFQLHFAPAAAEPIPDEDALAQAAFKQTALVRQAGPFRLPSR